MAKRVLDNNKMLEKYDGRVVEVDNLGQASLMMNEEFRGKFPLALRGILTSVGDPVDLRLTGYEFGFNGTTVDLRVKSIDELLLDGTEVKIRDPHPTWVNVICSEATSGWAFEYALDRSRAEKWANESGLSNEQRRMLKPALLVYDKTLLTKPKDPTNIFGVILPRDPELRKKAILKVYINNTSKFDLSKPIF